MKHSLFYDMLQDKISDSAVREILIGRTWTMCDAQDSIGLAMSPEEARRTLPWPGTLSGRSLQQLAAWILSWDAFESSVAMAAINASTNMSAGIVDMATTIGKTAQANLSVFEYFKPRLINKNVVVIGRYPGLELYEQQMHLTVLEQNPTANDLPGMACEYVIPDADWVFLTASSITNKTFPRLAELASDTNLVLMGPTVPWLTELAEFGVDFLAGTVVDDPMQLRSIVAEGGGVRIFDQAVSYRVLDLGQQEMQWHDVAISDLVSRREMLKTEMDSWYKTRRGSFPRKQELLTIDRELSRLDTQYKRLWDARHVYGEQRYNIC